MSKRRRWLGNFGVLVLNTLVLRLLFPAAASGAALFAGAHGWGLFNHFGAPSWVIVVVCVVALDLADLWDRLLGTYRDQPRAGHQDMEVGIPSGQETQTSY